MTSMIRCWNSAVWAASAGPTCEASPVCTGCGAVRASTFHAGGGVNGVSGAAAAVPSAWLDGAGGFGAGASVAATCPTAAVAEAGESVASLLPVRNENNPKNAVLTHQRPRAVERRDERVDVFHRVVHRERRTRRRRNTVAIHDRLRAVMS